MTADDDDLLAPDLVVDLQDLPLGDLRDRRDRCVAVETGLSYLRRMVQGPLDIASRELVRREVGGQIDRAAIIDELPGILADGPRPPGVGRLPQGLEPTEVDPEFSAELDGLLAGGVVASLHELDDRALLELQDDLTAFETKVSQRRRAYFDRIDVLQAELTRRYRDGEASVDELLP